jgi:tRNA/tmRNA/rRNA uracil-C5-methylase (TrmA/RlmC/RlmD family)
MLPPEVNLPIPTGCVENCRGCRHRTWSAQKSENQKLNWIRSRLTPWIHQVEAVRGLSEQRRWGYRTKSNLHAHWNGSTWDFGLLRRDEVIPIHDCPVHAERVNRLVKKLALILPSPTEFPLVYLCFAGSLVTLVLKTKSLPKLPEVFWDEFGVTGVFLNLNPAAGFRVFSARGWHLVWGKEWGNEDGFFYGPDSFQQLLPELHQNALLEAQKYLNPKVDDCVVDLYSGVGRSLQLWNQMNIKALGVELSGDAYRCAELNVGQGFSLRGRASERLPQLQSWVKEKKPNQVFVYANPPRLGLEPEVTSWIHSHSRPLRMAYLSCSVSTLARDLTQLCDSGYSVTRIIPYDFFPQTDHVETLALLDRR